MPTQWDEEKVANMLKLLNEGASTRVAAVALGTTRNAVIGKMHRLGLRVGSYNGWGKKAAEAQAKKQHRYRPRLSMFDMVIRPRPVIKFKKVPKVEVPGARACTLMDLDHNTCRWPLWCDDGEERLYCGASVDGKTYCTDHWRHAVNVRREPAGVFTIKKTFAKSPKSIVA
jgi:hypothetical protein